MSSPKTKPDPPFRSDFATLKNWQARAIVCGVVSFADLRVYLVIFDHCSRGQSARCWPGRKRIARLTGLSLSGVRKGLEHLSALGWIEVVTRLRDDKSQGSNYYVLPPPETAPTATREALQKMEGGCTPVAGGGPCSSRGGATGVAPLNQEPIEPHSPTESGDPHSRVTRVHSSLFEEQASPASDPDAFDVRCPTCAAPAGMECQTPSLKRTKVHAARRKLRQAPAGGRPTNGCNDATWLELYAGYPSRKTPEARARYFALTAETGWKPEHIAQRLAVFVDCSEQLGWHLPTLANVLDHRAGKLTDAFLEGLEGDAAKARTGGAR